MFVKLNKNVFFRQFSNYGYLSDNSLFGYKFLNDQTPTLGERFLSESASVMISYVRKIPTDVNDIIDNLMQVFVDVDYIDLKNDVLELFANLSRDGFLTLQDDETKCANEICDDFCSKVTAEDGMDDTNADTFCIKNQLKCVHIEIASECNERCVHCYIPHDEKNHLIPSQSFSKIIDECKRLNVINITISGGEPLLHPDIISFLKLCHEADMSVNVLTNLTLLTDEIINEMVKNPLLCVQTSLYAMDPETHDSITKVKGSHQKTVNNILRLVGVGIPVQISCPIMKQNKSAFFDVYQWGNEHNIPVVYDYVIFASLNHKNENLANRLSFDELRDAFRLQMTDDTMNLLLEKETEKLSLQQYEPICSICKHYLCVASNGNIFPCVGWQNNVLGNIREDSLEDIWECSEKVKTLRKITLADFSRCVKCPDRGFCTICMMSNSNENPDGDCFVINDYHCKVAQIIHEEVSKYLKRK